MSQKRQRIWSDIDWTGVHSRNVQEQY